MKTNETENTGSNPTFFIQSHRKVDGTTIVESGFETAKAALNAIDALPSTMGFGGLRVCRRATATGEAIPWTDWL